MNLFENSYRSRFKLTKDVVFYWVYGMDTEESKRALIALLNVVLDRKDDPIVSATLLNPVQKGYRIGDKPTVMDIKCETQSGELIDVEMQNGSLTHYPERTLFYGGKMINSSLEEGEEYGTMKKSIVISFVEKVMFPNIPEIHTAFYVKEEKTGYHLADRFCLHFVELGKVDSEKPVEELTPLEKLSAYIKYCSDPDKEDYTNQLLASGEEAIEMSEHVFRKVTESDLAREMLEREEKAAHDIATMKADARRAGFAEGAALGRRQMKQVMECSLQGMAVEEIAKRLDLSIDQVREMLGDEPL